LGARASVAGIAGCNGNSRPSLNSTIRPSAFNRKRMLEPRMRGDCEAFLLRLA